jgi:glyoxylase-like metal-dependent hydrolase (beta-lactamase superfamily II)
MQLRQISVGPSGTNTYLLVCPAAQRQLLIDPGDETKRVLELVASALPRPTLDAIVITHRHQDHIGALADVVAATHAQVIAGYDDADAITQETGVPVHHAMRHGDTFQIGFMQFEVIGLRGHTPGSIGLAIGDPSQHQQFHVFTGDALLQGHLGDTANDPMRHRQLYTDVVTRIFGHFDDDTTLRPGHGPATSVGAERINLREWREL